MRIVVIIVFFVSLVTASAQAVDVLEFRKVDYFEVVSKANGESEEKKRDARAARRAPLGTGSQSLHPNYGREYALQRIMVGVREGRLRLEETVLVSTGFLPRIMHGRIKLRLGSALNPGDLADEMTAKALEDTTRADKISREGYEKALRDYQTRKAQKE